jgi:hypothetical protein
VRARLDTDRHTGTVISGGSGVSYTNGGPTTDAGTHCSLTTDYGKGAYTPPCTLGSTFTPREFNGTLYTELPGPAGPALAVSGACPGATTLSFSNCTPTSTVAVLDGLAESFTKPGNPCGGLVLGINNPTLGAMMSTNGAGNATLTFNAPAAACGKTVQGVDVASCTATHTVVLSANRPSLAPRWTAAAGAGQSRGGALVGPGRRTDTSQRSLREQAGRARIVLRAICPFPLIPDRKNMFTPLLTAVLLVCASAPLSAQQLTDAGFPNFPGSGATTVGGVMNGVGCGSGTTNAQPYNSNNAFAGNMFDIAPTVDMTIECVDVNWSAVESIDVAIWWCPNTVVGNDVNQLGTWVQFATGTAMAAGLNLPTNVNLTPSAGNPVFLAGQTYGIYVQVTNYATTAGSLRYTNQTGPVTFTGTHCSLTTYYGKADGLTAGTFTYRGWNGTLYTEVAGPTGPALAASGTCPGATSLSVSNCTPNSNVAILYGAAGAFVKPGNPCAGLALAISNPSLGAMLGTNGSGAAVLNFNAPAAACGKTVQGVDVATCTATNAVVL